MANTEATGRLAMPMDDAAVALAVSKATLRRMIRRGELPAVRIGLRGVRIPVEVVRELAGARPGRGGIL